MHGILIKELRELVDELGDKHFMLMGDFNYPDIDWGGQQCPSSASVNNVSYSWNQWRKII